MYCQQTNFYTKTTTITTIIINIETWKQLRVNIKKTNLSMVTIWINFFIFFSLFFSHELWRRWTREAKGGESEKKHTKNRPKNSSQTCVKSKESMKPLQTKRCIIEIVVYYASFDGNKDFHLAIVFFFFLLSIYTSNQELRFLEEKKNDSLFSHSISH